MGKRGDWVACPYCVENACAVEAHPKDKMLVRAARRPGVTFACFFQSHNECSGTRMQGGLPVGECCCPCHQAEKKP